MKLEMILTEKELKRLFEALDDAIRNQEKLEKACKSELNKNRHRARIVLYKSLRTKIKLAKSCIEERT